MAARWLNDRQQQVWRQLIGVHVRLLARLDQELQTAEGLSLGDYEVLVVLSEAPERAVRMADLATKVALSPSGLTRRVDGLVRAGLVRREACPSDRRGSFAVLTDTGLATLERAAITHVAGARRYVIDALGDVGVTRLGALLGTIDAALEEETQQPPQERAGPRVTSPPRSAHALVPPATDTAG
jgi:DNA-binding MarR family transcriptional regulator